MQRSIRADEAVDGTAVTTRIGSSSVTTEIRFYGLGGEDDLRSIVELIHAHVDLENGEPIPIPDDAKTRLLAK